jgi:hypothetical protein
VLFIVRRPNYGNAPENFAVLRHIALNMIKKEISLKKKSIKSKRSGRDGATTIC